MVEGEDGEGQRGKERQRQRQREKRGGYHETIELSCLEFKERYNYGHIELKF